MSKVFKYSVLQYKHSLTLNEAVNIGILFYFPEESTLEFVSGALNRVKSIYPELDGATINQILKGIHRKIENQDNLFKKETLKTNLKHQIFTTVLNEDSSALQFTDPITVVDSFANHKKAIASYSRILLPGLVQGSKKVQERHSDTYLLKKYTSLVLSGNKELEKKLKRNEIIKSSEVSLKFDIAWQNGSLNLVKPISFDLTDEQSIQSKSVNYFGYLTLLNANDYAVKNNYRFDLLISKPQNRTLYKAYDKAVEILDEANAPKKLVTEDKLKSYSEETVRELFDR